MTSCWEIHSDGPDTTRRLGRDLGRSADPGLVVALNGELGSGKTCLAQGIARGLGVPDDVPVTSPTYTLINPYSGRLELFHLDLFRLGDPGELDELGFRDMFSGDNVVLVEWADRFPEALPAENLSIGIEVLEPDSRRISFVARGRSAHRSLDRLKQRFELPRDDVASRVGSRR